jgi:hypothetical protein
MIDFDDLFLYDIDVLPYNKTRKNYLEKRGLIKCGFCKYHKNENVERVPYERKHNKRKLTDRSTIRKICFDDEE